MTTTFSKPPMYFASKTPEFNRWVHDPDGESTKPTEDMARRLTEVSEMAESHFRRASEAEEEAPGRRKPNGRTTLDLMVVKNGELLL